MIERKKGTIQPPPIIIPDGWLAVTFSHTWRCFHLNQGKRPRHCAKKREDGTKT